MRILTTLAAIGGFLFGYDTGVISGAMPPISRTFGLTTVQQEVVVSATVLAAFISSLVGGTINKKYGRRYTILMASCVFTIGAVLMGTAWDYHSLVLGRIIVGVGIGLASLTTPIYIAEVAAPSMRGTLVTVNGLLICFGQFSAGMIDGILDEIDPVDGWRVMLGLAAIPSIVMFVGFQYMPESPRWLVMEGRYDEAKTVLNSIRESDNEADGELQEIINVCALMMGGSSAEGTDEDDDDADADDAFQYNSDDSGDALELNPMENDHSLSPLRFGEANAYQDNASTSKRTSSSFLSQVKDMVGDPPTLRALKLGCGMMVLQQLSGINTVRSLQLTFFIVI